MERLTSLVSCTLSVVISGLDEWRAMNILREIHEDFTLGVNNPREILEGAEDYEDFCASCWGERGIRANGKADL